MIDTTDTNYTYCMKMKLDTYIRKLKQSYLIFIFHYNIFFFIQSTLLQWNYKRGRKSTQKLIIDNASTWRPRLTKKQWNNSRMNIVSVLELSRNCDTLYKFSRTTFYRSFERQNASTELELQVPDTSTGTYWKQNREQR